MKIRNEEIEIHDCPDSLGALNMQRRAQQFGNIEWTPLSEIPQNRITFLPGTVVKGMPYSSVRGVDKFIGHEISIETFMTAVKNPASVLYTRNLREPGDPEHNSDNNNCATYYGIVCSTFAGYVLGIEPRYTTRHWHEIPGMHKIEDQSPYGLKIGDSLCTPKRGHVIMVYDIVRTLNGRIKYIELIEGVNPHVKSSRFTPDAFMELVNSKNYIMYRYDGIIHNTYEPSDFVAVDDESVKTPAYNTVLALDYGNKANYRNGEPVSIHVMDVSADLLRIQRRDNAASEWETLSEIKVRDIARKTVNGGDYTIHTFTPSDNGYYQAYCVMNDGNASDAVLWQVAAATLTAASPATANGEVAFTFQSSENAKPLYVSWNDSTGSTFKCQMLTHEEIVAGKAVTAFDRSGTWYLKLYVQTEYGRISTTAQVEVGP